MDATTALILLAGSAASSAASMYNNQQSIKYAQEANDTSVGLANTAHQREVRDLEAAGLNPILSAHSNGAATPQLRVPGLESIDGGIGSSAGSIARAMNGMVDAELETAKADASTAQSYADRADELVAAELSEARARSEKAWDEVQVSDVAQEADRIDALARLEALQGRRPGEVDVRVRDDKVYKDLVEQYRNEISSGRYKSSLGRSVFQDVMSGASSASDIYSRTKGRQAGKVPRR